MVLSYIMTPVYMNYFSSNVVLGMWFTLVSIINWLIMLDFGIGSSARNYLIIAYGKKDKEEVQKILSSGMFANALIILVTYIIMYIFINNTNCYRWVGVSVEDISYVQLQSVIYILCIGVLLRIFGSFFANIYYSLQNAMASSIMSIFSNFLILIYMLVKIKNRETDNITELAMAHAIAYNIPSVIAFINLFFFKFRDARLGLKYIKYEYIKKLTGSGLKFFYLQIIITIAYGSKELLISWFVGADAVVEYNIYQKIIGMAGTLFGLALLPVWSEVSEKYAERENDKLKVLYVKGIKFLATISVGQILLAVAFPLINDIWLGNKAVSMSWYACLLFCGYNAVYMLVMLNYNFLCGMDKINKLISSLTLTVIGGVILSYLFTRMWPYWSTINLAIIVATIPTVVITTGEVIKNISMKKVETQDNS